MLDVTIIHEIFLLTSEIHCETYEKVLISQNLLFSKTGGHGLQLLSTCAPEVAVCHGLTSADN